jgi:streptogramin lyase
MRRMRRTAVLAILVAGALGPAPAHGAELVAYGGVAGNSHGVRIGPDGNLWVTEENNHSVARFDLQGKLLQRIPVGGAPGTVVNGPGGRVWVAVAGDDAAAKKLVWFDALAPTPTAHAIPTSTTSDCSPVGIAPGGNGAIYFSLPNTGLCGGTPSRIAFMNENGTGMITVVAGRGTALDLVVTAGKLYAADFFGDVVRRLKLDASLTVESTVNVPAGSGPAGLAADGAGNIWTGLFNHGKVARFPALQNGGDAEVFTPSGGTLSSPFGLAPGFDGAMYVAGLVSGNVARVDGAGTFSFFTPPEGSSPLRIASGTDSDLWVSDRSSNGRVLRLVFGKPRLGATGGDADGATSAVLRADVDPRGAGQVVFDYGTSTAYGQSTAGAATGSRAWPATERATVTGLAPSTTYHARARAANAEGETVGDDFTFTTPATPPPPPPPPIQPPPAATPPLGAKIVFVTKRRRGVTRVTKLRVQKLVGGETIRVRCSGKGCPRKGRTVTRRAAGTQKLDALLKKRRLRKGTKVRVLVTKAGFKGRAATLTVRKGTAPRIRRTCLAVGGMTPTTCA